MTTHVSAAPGTPVSLAGGAAPSGPAVSIGLLHSLSGTMALSETALLDAERMAVDEINSAGGVLGRRIEALVADGASQPERFAQGAEELLAAGVSALFGCWTSASRKAVRPVVEGADSLLWYPVQYEGLEESPCICYAGSCLNQQVMPAVEWALGQLGDRLFLLGSDYVFPRTANPLIRSMVAGHGGSIVDEVYVALGAQDFSAAIARVRQTQPHAVINTLNGDSNLAFYRQYRAAGILPAQIPVVATSVTETELASVASVVAGHYACWSYFQSLDTPVNREFVSRFKGRYGGDRVVSAPMVTAYVQLYLWQQAAERAGSTAPAALRRHLPGCALLSPMGELRIEANRHVSMPVRVGRLKGDGQFAIVWRKDELIAPLPWLGVENLDFPGKEMVKQSMAAFADNVNYNWLLEREVAERKALQAALGKANADLEGRVEARTRELATSMADLSQEVGERQRAEQRLRSSHDAALNMMEDAVEARRQAEQSAAELRHEIAEHEQAKAALRESAERYRCLFESSHDAIMTLEPPSWRFTSGNAATLRVFGAGSEAEFVALGPWELSPEQQPDGRTSAEKAKEMIEAAMREGSRFYEWTHRRVSGQEFPATVLLSRMQSAQTVFLQATVRDITESKRAEQALATSERRFRDTAEHAQEWIWETDTEGRYTYASQAVERTVGYTPEEILDRHFYDLFHPDDRESLKAAALAVFAAKQSFRGFRNRNVHRDGHIVWLATSGQPLLDGKGNLLGYRGVDTDTTERERAEERDRLAHQVLNRLNQPGRMAEMIHDVMQTVQKGMDFEAVGIRVREGDDFPYHVANGFSEDFLSTENSLVARAKDGGVCRKADGSICLECTCGLVLSGTAGPADARFTKGGSFWTNDSLPLLDLSADQDPRLHPRNRCIHAGFLSVALVPLRAGDEIIGLLQLNDRRPGRLTLELVYFLEGLATSIAIALKREQVVEEKGRLEAQFAQAQKMESVGRLAGGVAHDFNNLLMGIMNYVELCRDELPAGHPIRGYLDEITSDAQRSADLTRQLLAFARKQTISPKALDLNDTVAGMLKLLRRLIGEAIAINWRPGADLWPVLMDPSQIDQILANLAVNARDAIGGVGSISLETRNVTLDHSYTAMHPGSLPGSFVLLTVSDSGCGMDGDVLAHVFEPFFTTKELGKGTGLGLATVYGIVTQNRGFIDVSSEPGKGTSFRIHLPRLVVQGVAAAAAVARSARPRGNETILLVEDEKSVRITTGIFLKDLGYAVLVAADPKEALLLAAQHPAEIHLLITDVVMPGMSGRDLADRLSELRPATRQRFISGFTADIIAREGMLDRGLSFLCKPFSRDDLAGKVRDVLGG